MANPERARGMGDRTPLLAVRGAIIFPNFKRPRHVSRVAEELLTAARLSISIRRRAFPRGSARCPKPVLWRGA